MREQVKQVIGEFQNSVRTKGDRRLCLHSWRFVETKDDWDYFKCYKCQAQMAKGKNLDSSSTPKWPSAIDDS